MYVLKLFRVTAGKIHSFRVCSKETLRIMNQKYSYLDFSKETNIRFRIKNPDLDFRIETHPTFLRKRGKTCNIKNRAGNMQHVPRKAMSKEAKREKNYMGTLGKVT